MPYYRGHLISREEKRKMDEAKLRRDAVAEYKKQQEAKEQKMWGDLYGRTTTPGFYSGMQEGPQGRWGLRPEFTASAPEGQEGYINQLQRFATEGFGEPTSLRDTALDRFTTAGESRLASALSQAATQGRGLRGVDQTSLGNQSQLQSILGRQNIRQAYGRGFADDAVDRAAGQQSLLQGMPGVYGGQMSVQRANANRLASEMDSLNRHKEELYKATLAGRQSKDNLGSIS